jgi:hypothetical protein
VRCPATRSPGSSAQLAKEEDEVKAQLVKLAPAWAELRKVLNELVLRASEVVLAKGCEEVVACLLAASTHLGAEAAVLVVGGVLLALLGAGQAGHGAGFDARTDEAKVGRRLPCQDAAGGVANVGAVEVEPYTPNQVSALVLADTVVGAGSTASDAVDTLLNAPQDQVAIQGCRVRMQLEYLRKAHVHPLLVQAGQQVFASSRS